MTQRDKGVIQRAYINKVGQDKKIQTVNASGLSEFTELEHFQPAGFASNPGSGDKVEAVLANLGDDPSKAICLGVIGDREYHLKVEDGEAAIYAPKNPEHKVLLKPDGIYLDSDNVMVRRGGGFKKVAAEGDLDTDGDAIV